MPWKEAWIGFALTVLLFVPARYSDADDDFDPADDIEGSAFVVGAKPTPEDEAIGRAMADAGVQYAECLKSEDDSWFSKADYTVCDSTRDAYAALLAPTIATVAVGCLEERILGAARIEGQTCAELSRLAAIVPAGRAREER